ncbi:MAG: hypothetical protein V8R07_09085 [Bacteroides fragilis]
MERKNSGNASALLGFLMFVFGGLLSPLTGIGKILYSDLYHYRGLLCRDMVLYL